MSDQSVLESDTVSLTARAARASVMLVATVDRYGGGVDRHRVRDVSTGGIRIDGAADLRVGERLSVSVGALCAIPATVQWVREGCAGLAFAEPINPDDARKKPPVSGAGTAPAVRAEAPRVPAAGWIGDLRDAYRR